GAILPHSSTPLLRVAGFEDEDEDDDEAPCGQLWTAVRLETQSWSDDGETFLQVDEQIEHPKPPTNLEQGSFVACKQRVHRGDELEKFLRIKKYFGEFLG